MLSDDPDSLPRKLLTREPDVTLEEFFDPEFMDRHTRFSSFSEFWEHGPWSLEGPSDLEQIPEEQLDSYVARTTTFDTWRRMRNRAADREIRDRLMV